MNNVIDFPIRRIYIGDSLRDRMIKLGMSVERLAEEAILDEDIIKDILLDRTALSEIDDLDLDFMEQALYCTKGYFSNEAVRKKDLVNCFNRNSVKYNLVVAKLQRFTEDFVFIRNLYESTKDK